MKYFSEDSEYIKGECETCKRVLKVKRANTYTVPDGYKLKTGIKCFCGSFSEEIVNNAKTTSDAESYKSGPSSEVRCPRCKSNQITANKKGFGLGKAAAGGILLGPLGLLGGFLGSNKIMITCLKCGHSWKP